MKEEQGSVNSLGAIPNGAPTNNPLQGNSQADRLLAMIRRILKKKIVRSGNS
jgi:hypothetical protein